VRRLRRAVLLVGRRPGRLAGAAVASLVMWGWLWSLSWFLLDAIGYRWPAWHVVVGSAAASLSNILPFNLVANFGTMETGWIAAFAALGVPVETAAATGLVCHLWAIVLTAVLGGIAWGVLVAASRSRTGDEPAG
jgi:uncharacterized membrane protein YbhN (UPF0104 family)